ncbi:MAG: SGNH/GDSL hydrolase family protein [Ginsengibacter sp.]
MKKKYINCLLPIITGLLCANVYAQESITSIDVHNKDIQYEGRIDLVNPGVAEIYWPGSSIKIKFKGTGVKAILKEQRAGNYYNIIIDGDSITILKPDTIKKTYTLASQLSDGEHTVEIFRRTAWNGVGSFYGFQLPAGTIISSMNPKKRMIEFYGNSITCGSGMYQEDAPGGTENNYLSYAAVTARHFDARYTCIARSGIGLMVSWFNMVMPDICNRQNPFDSNSVWDFSKATPDIVIINLFQNDYAIVNKPDGPEFKRRFGTTPPTEDFIISSYRKFIQSIRNHYAEANIICVLGNMDAVSPGSRWPGYIENAVASFGDKKIYTHFFSYKNTPGHPNVAEHKQMAESLSRFIEEHIKW